MCAQHLLLLRCLLILLLGRTWEELDAPLQYSPRTRAEMKSRNAMLAAKQQVFSDTSSEASDYGSSADSAHGLWAAAATRSRNCLLRTINHHRPHHQPHTDSTIFDPPPILGHHQQHHPHNDSTILVVSTYNTPPVLDDSIFEPPPILGHHQQQHHPHNDSTFSSSPTTTHHQLTTLFLNHHQY